MPGVCRPGRHTALGLGAPEPAAGCTGQAALAKSPFDPVLRQALDIPYAHHERWDGSGYPRGLKGEQIPLAARIFAVVDVYDALRSDRPYRRAWTDEAARDYLREQSGKQFDPRMVEAFLSMLGE